MEGVRIIAHDVNRFTRRVKMQIIGLTGGISSGKSQVTQFFEKQNVPVLDADAIVKQLQQPGSPLLQDIAHALGENLVQEGVLNRQALGELIFTNEKAKETLNALIHPRIRQIFEEEIEGYRQQKTPLLVLDIPLLFESHFEDLADFIVVVSVSYDTQLERLMKRDGISKDYAHSKIMSQMPLTLKCERADYVIHNNHQLEDLQKELNYFYKKVLKCGK